MNSGSPVLTFAAAAPYDVTLRKVRAALARQGLYTAAELDVTARIRRRLGAGVASCTVLYVDDPAVLLEAVVFHRGAALLIPQPLVVTGDERHTEVLIRLAGDVPASVREPLRDLQNRMTRAMDGIAEQVAGDSLMMKVEA